jgi:hypothetical protein
MTPGHAGVTAALEEVALAVGLRDMPQSPARIHREVVARLKGTGGLVVVDEAQHLSVAALDALRSIHDAAGVGLALVGNDLVYGRMVGNRAAYLDRLFSRIGKRVRISGATQADIEAVARAAGGGRRAVGGGEGDRAAGRGLARLCEGFKAGADDGGRRRGAACRAACGGGAARFGGRLRPVWIVVRGD